MSVEVVDLKLPETDEVVQALSEGLKKNFAEVSVKVTSCPDLSQPPFHLAAPGLSGNPRIVDVGGVPYLMPLPRKDKLFDLADLVTKLVPGVDEPFMIGAGAGPFDHVGVNSEMMSNIKLSKDGRVECNGSRVAYIRSGSVTSKEGDESVVLETLPKDQPRCGLMMNLLVSEGKPGQVIEVIAEKRVGEENFVTCMRKALKDRFGESQVVAVGGAFLVERGTARLHVMPEFSEKPLESDSAVDKWLRYFNMKAPLVCLSVFVSHDPGLDLRIEHTHCFSTHGDGGHYHYDTSADIVRYRGYFVLGEKLVRIDRPQKS